MKAAGTKAMHNTLDADPAEAVDAGNGLVTIPLTGHGFKVGSHIGIRGSVAYDGTYEIQAVAANTFNIYATFVEEVFVGDEKVRPELESEQFFRVLETRLHLNAVGGAAEDFTINLASGQPAGTAHDVNLLTQGMNATKDVVADWSNALRFFNNNDKLIFQYANGNTRDWGLEIKYLVAG